MGAAASPSGSRGQVAPLEDITRSFHDLGLAPPSSSPPLQEEDKRESSSEEEEDTDSSSESDSDSDSDSSSDSSSSRPLAGIYRGPIACDYCAESIGLMLRRSPAHYRVVYLGPHEKAGDIMRDTLSQLDVFVQPGGGDDTDATFAEGAAYYAEALREYVTGGGKFLGVCLGAFFARGPEATQKEKDEHGGTLDRTYFGLLPPGAFVDSERFTPGAQERSARDTVVQTDVYFHSSWALPVGKDGAHDEEGGKREVKKGRWEQGRWQYFQDGGRVFLNFGNDTAQALHRAGAEDSGGDSQKRGDSKDIASPLLPHNTKVLARYTYTGHPSSVVYPFGRGWVGLSGTHPEAEYVENDWYDLGFPNPNHYRKDVGWDLVGTLFEAGRDK